MFDRTTEEILSAVRNAAIKLSFTAYVHGRYAQNLLFPKLPVKNTINIIIVKNKNYSLKKLYREMTKTITINREIKNTPSEYFVVSNEHIIEFNIVDDVKDILYTNIDAIFYDIVSQQIVGETPPEILSLSPDLTTQHIFAIASDYANFDLPVGVSVETLSLFDICPTSSEYLIPLFLSIFPGKAIEFLLRFNDGKKWLSSQLINLAISQNIQLPEEITPESMLGGAKRELLNIYGEFYSIHNTYDTQQLAAILRILFDAPVTEDKLPYIQQIMRLRH